MGSRVVAADIEANAPLRPEPGHQKTSKWSCSCGRCLCFCVRLPCHPIRAPYWSVMVMLGVVVLMGYGVSMTHGARTHGVHSARANNTASTSTASKGSGQARSGQQRAATNTSVPSTTLPPSSVSASTIKTSSSRPDNATTTRKPSSTEAQTARPAVTSSTTRAPITTVPPAIEIEDKNAPSSELAAVGNKSVTLAETSSANSTKLAGAPYDRPAIMITSNSTMNTAKANDTAESAPGISVSQQSQEAVGYKVEGDGEIDASSRLQRVLGNETTRVELNLLSEAEEENQLIEEANRKTYNFTTIRSDQYGASPSQAWLEKVSELGVTTHVAGEGIQFDAAFEHVIVVKWAAFSELEEIVDKIGPHCNPFPAHSYDRYDTPDDKANNRSSGQFVRESLRARCLEFKRELKLVTSIFLKNNLPSVKMRRKQRFVIIGAILIGSLFAAVVGLAGGMIYHAKKIKDLENDLQRLAELVKAGNVETLLLRENFVGLTTILKKRGSDHTSAHSALEAQQEYFNSQLQNIAARLAAMGKTDTITASQLLHLNEVVHANLIASGLLQATISARLEFEQSLLSLKLGLLPSSVVPFQMLFEILIKIERDLPPGYNLAIPLAQIDTYYLLSFCRFAVDQNNLVIRFSVPLVFSEKGRREVVFFQPVALPFYNKAHGLGQGDGDNVILKDYEMSDRWAWNKHSDKVYEVSLSRWVCHQRGLMAMCYSYHPEALQAPKRCLKSLLEEEIPVCRRDCRFELTDATYQPISLGNGTYALHENYRNASFDVYEHCPHAEPNKLDLDLTAVVTVVSIDPGCYLSMAQHFRPGPLGSVGRDETYIKANALPLMSADQSSLLSDIATQRPDLIIANFSKSLNLSDDMALLDQIANETRQGSERLRKLQKDYDDASQVRGLKSARSEVTELLQALWELVVTLMVFALLVAVVQQGNFLYLMAPVIIIRRSGVQAFAFEEVISLPSFTDLFPDFDVNFLRLLTWFTWLVCLMVLGFAVYWSTRFGRTIYLSTHTASSTANQRFRFWLLISYRIKRHVWYKGQYIQHIILRVPVRASLPTGTVGLEVSAPEFLFMTSKERQVLRSVEPLIIRGKFSDGTFSCNIEEALSINLARLVWDNKLLPYDLTNTDQGLARVQPIGDPAPML